MRLPIAAALLLAMMAVPARAQAQPLDPCNGSNCCWESQDTLDLAVRRMARARFIHVDTMICEGSEFTLSASAEYADSVEWLSPSSVRITSVDVWGVDSVRSSSFTKTNVQVGDAGIYAFKAHNSCYDSVIYVNLHVNAQIQAISFAHDTAVKALEGEFETLTLTVTETQNAVGYIWQHYVDVDGGEWIDLDTTPESVRVWAKTDIELADSGLYRITAFNGCVGEEKSDSVRVIVVPMASIRIEPQPDAYVCEFDSTTVTVTAEYADLVEWFYINDLEQVVSRGSWTEAEHSVGFGNAQVNHAGLYMAVASNAHYHRDTAYVTLHVNSTISSDYRPATAVAICEGSPLTLTIETANAAYYEWFKEDTVSDNLQKSTEPDLYFDHIELSDAGKYIVRSENSCTKRLDTVTVTVNKSAHVNLTPDGESELCFMTEGLEISADTSAASSLLWYKNGAPFTPNVDGKHHTITNATTSDTGTYMLVAHTAYNCNHDTAWLHVAVNNVLTITAGQPKSIAACPSEQLNLTFTVEGADEVQWHKGVVGTGTETFPVVDGEVAISYLPPVAGTYIIEATNTCAEQPYTLRDTIHIEVSNDVFFNDTLKDTSICQYLPFILSVDATYMDSLVWFKLTTGADKRIGKGNAGNNNEYEVTSSMSPNDEGKYYALIYNKCGADKYSDTITVSIVYRMSLTQYLTGEAVKTDGKAATLCEGEAKSYSIAGSNIKSIAWYVRNSSGVNDSTALGGAENTAFGFTADYNRHNGRHLIVEARSECDTIRDSVLITVLKPAVIDENLSTTDTMVCIADGVLTLTAKLSEAVDSVQWYNPLGAPIAYTTFVLGDVTTYVKSEGLTKLDSGKYMLVAFNKLCNTDTLYATAHVNSSVVEITPLQNASFYNFGTLTMTYEAAEAVRYVWYRNNNDGNGFVAVDSTSGATYIKERAEEGTDNGTYYVVASNGCGAITSNNATVAFKPGVKITIDEPTSGTLCAGSDFKFAATATNADSIAWYQIGNPTPRKTRGLASAADVLDTLYFEPAQMSDNGKYVVKAWSDGIPEPYVSDTAQLTVDNVMVKPNPLFPADTTVCEGSELTLSFNVQYAKGYRWILDNDTLFSETTATLTIAEVAAGDVGTYTIEAYNDCQLVSHQVNVQMQLLPVITTQPTGDTICENEPFTLTATAANADYYIWFRQGSVSEPPVTGGPDTAGIGTTYHVANAEMKHAGEYFMRAFSTGNKCGHIDTKPNVHIGVERLPEVTEDLSDNENVKNDTLRICEHEPISLTFVALHADTIVWYKGNTPIGGHLPAQTVYVISNAADFDDDKGLYIAKAINDCGSKSDTLFVVVNREPNITGYLAANTGSNFTMNATKDTLRICEGEELSLTFETEYADSIVWTRNGARIAGYAGTQTSYTVATSGSPIVYDTHNGDYTVKAFNGCGVPKTDKIYIKVDREPEVSLHLAANANNATNDTLRICEGAPLTLTFNTMHGDSIVWTKNGARITGYNGTVTTYHLTDSITPENQGTYVATVINACNIVSETLYIRVDTTPRITLESDMVSFCGGGSGTIRLAGAVQFAAGAKWEKVGSTEVLATTWEGNKLVYTTTTIPTSTTDYKLTAYNRGACNDTEATARVSITGAALNITEYLLGYVGNKDTAYCEGTPQSLTFNGTGIEEIIWYTPNAENGTDTIKSSEVSVGGLKTEFAFNAEYAQFNGKYIKVEAKNGCGDIRDSVRIDVNKLAVIGTYPQKDTALCNPGAALVLSLNAANQTGITWYSPDGEISATNGTIPNSPTNNGYWRYVVANECNTIDSGINVFFGGAISVREKMRDTIVTMGQELRLTLAANNFHKAKWYHAVDGKKGTYTELTGETDSTYIISKVGFADTGYYRVEGRNACSAVAYDTVHVTLRPAYVIVPADTIVCTGTSLTIAAATYGATITAWYRVGSTAAVSNDSILHLTATPAVAGNYYCEIVLEGGSLLADTINIAVVSPITVASTRADKSICVNSELRLGVTASDVRTYEWKLAGNPIAGATTDSLIIPNVTSINGGEYTVDMKNACGTQTYTAGTITIAEQMLQTTLKYLGLGVAAVDRCEGDSLKLAFTVTNADEVKWYKNGALQTWTGNAQAFKVTAGDNGKYVAVAKNPCGELRDTVEVNVHAGIIFTPLKDTTICTYSNLTLTLEATNGTGDWIIGGNPIGATLTITSANPAVDAGKYSYRITPTGGSCSTIDSFITVTVGGIALGSTNRGNVADGSAIEVCEGDSIALLFVADNFTKNTWSFQDSELAETDSLYTIPVVGSEHAGTYSVIMLNGCGQHHTGSVTVAVTPSVKVIQAPEDIAICEGVPLTLRIVAENYKEIRWLRQDDPTVAKGDTIYLGHLSYRKDGYTYTYEITGNRPCDAPITGSVVITVNRDTLKNLRVTNGTLTLCKGEPMTLKFAADNFYRNEWYKNGELMTLTDSIYRVDSVTLDDAGVYRVRMFNGCDNDGYNDSIKVEVHDDPMAEFTTRAESSTLCATGSGSITLTFAAVNEKSSTIRWYHDGTHLTANNGQYTITIAGDVSNNGTYRYEVESDGLCPKTITDSATVVITDGEPENISTLIPADTTICAGDSVTLSLTADNLFGSFWYRDGVQVADVKKVGNTNVASLTVKEAGSYTVAVYNGCDTIPVTGAATVRVLARAKATLTPQDSGFCAGSDIKLFAEAQGDELTGYTWFFNGEILQTGKAVDTLTMVADNTAEGTYRFATENMCSSDTADAKVKVYYPIDVTTPLSEDGTKAGCIGYDLNLSIVAENATKYEWYKDGNLLSGETWTSYDIYKMREEDEGTYVVVASNPCSEVRDTVYLTISLPPSAKLADGQPTEMNVDKGETFTIIGESENGAQWYFNGVAIAIEDNATATSDTLTVTNATYINSGQYRYVATSGCGSDSSEVVLVSVNDENEPELKLTVVKWAETLSGEKVNRVAWDSTVVFYLQIINPSEITATDMFVNDPLPKNDKEGKFGFTYDETDAFIQGKRPFDLNSLNFAAGTLQPGKDTIFTYRVKAINTGTYVDSVYVTCYSPTKCDLQYATTINVFSEKDVEVTQTLALGGVRLGVPDERYPWATEKKDSSNITVGDLVTYTVRVENVGKSIVSNVTVLENWPVNAMSYAPQGDEVPPKKGMLVVTDNAISLEIGDMEPGDWEEFDVTFKMKREGFHTITATVETPDDEGDNTRNNKADAKVYVRGPRIYPTTITPNGDGINDCFEVSIGLTFPENELWIYNRTGNMVYYRKGYFNDFCGGNLPDGTYIYIFSYKGEGGKTSRLNGTIWMTRQ